MDKSLKGYFVVTGGYWAFTITDGAIRMLVVLYFHLLGYSPFEVAMLFLFYEACGVVTNLTGGWLAARLGLNVTMQMGMLLQIVALGMLAVPDEWLSVAYVMFAQAMSGIAKDLNKMSAKASVKLLVPKNADSKLFQWVAILTGSKNALKGVGFFIGALLLEMWGFQNALIILATSLFLVLIVVWIYLPRDMGKAKSKAKFTKVFSQIPSINYLSAARFFLFGSRDVWFVVGLPVFLYSVVGWDFTEVGTFLALWVIGYGFVQGFSPKMLPVIDRKEPPNGRTALLLVLLLCLIPAAMALFLSQGYSPDMVLIAGLALFGMVFALNSAVHSYLILAYSEHDNVAMNVGFYYMANAGGRLVGTVLSGGIYQLFGFEGCLLASSIFVLLATLLSRKLP